MFFFLLLVNHMCLLIWTVFSGERCGPLASCFAQHCSSVVHEGISFLQTFSIVVINKEDTFGLCWMNFFFWLIKTGLYYALHMLEVGTFFHRIEFWLRFIINNCLLAWLIYRMKNKHSESIHLVTSMTKKLIIH